MPARMLSVPSWHMKDTSKSLRMLAGFCRKLKSTILCHYRREMLALVWAVKCFRPYLWGRRFIIRTDHNSLRWLQNFKDPQGQIARWLEILAEYDFTIQHRPGLKHSNADALSRLPCKQCGRQDSEATAAPSEMKKDESNDVANSVTEAFQAMSSYGSYWLQTLWAQSSFRMEFSTCDGKTFLERGLISICSLCYRKLW